MDLVPSRAAMQSQRVPNQGRKDSVLTTRTAPENVQNRPNQRPRKSGQRFTQNNRELRAITSSFRQLGVEWKYYSLPENTSLPADQCFIYSVSQLIVKPSECDRAKSSVTNKIPDWESVVNVVCHDAEGIECPICLYSPIAPRMERCGHIYCWPCAMRYMFFENDGIKKNCVICGHNILFQNMKPVSVVSVEPLHPNSVLDMVLLHRSAANVIRFVNGSADESCDYNFLCRENVTKTLSSLNNTKTSLESYYHACLLDDPELADYTLKLIEQLNSGSPKIKRSKTKSSTPSKNANSDQKPEVLFKFYQASDGRHIFLDGLMWKCLEYEYADSELPANLSLKVVYAKHYRMDAVLKKRWRYLSHLPVGRSFTMVEVDLKPLISEKTMEYFQIALQRREEDQFHRDLEDIELTEQKEITESQIPGILPGYTISSPQAITDITELNDDDFLPLGHAAVQPRSELTTVRSFADVTRQGTKGFVGGNRVADFNSRPSTSGDSPDQWPSLLPSTSWQAPPPKSAWKSDPSSRRH